MVNDANIDYKITAEFLSWHQRQRLTMGLRELMKKDGQKTMSMVHYLAYAGLLPFIVTTVCISAGIESLPLFGRVDKILSVYTLVITSFLAGAHWGQGLIILDASWAIYLAILSNALAIMLWLGFILTGFKTKISMFAVLLGLLLYVDHQLFKIGVISSDYYCLRFRVSCVVISLLILAGVLT